MFQPEETAQNEGACCVVSVSVCGAGWQAASSCVVKDLECWLPLAFEMLGVYVEKFCLTCFSSTVNGPNSAFIISSDQTTTDFNGTTSDSII